MEVENLMKVIAVTVNSPYPSFEHLRKIYEWDMKQLCCICQWHICLAMQVLTRFTSEMDKNVECHTLVHLVKIDSSGLFQTYMLILFLQIFYVLFHPTRIDTRYVFDVSVSRSYAVLCTYIGNYTYVSQSFTIIWALWLVIFCYLKVRKFYYTF